MNFQLIGINLLMLIDKFCKLNDWFCKISYCVSGFLKRYNSFLHWTGRLFLRIKDELKKEKFITKQTWFYKALEQNVLFPWAMTWLSHRDRFHSWNLSGTANPHTAHRAQLSVFSIESSFNLTVSSLGQHDQE